jgi:excisionase family DNA binding protein
MPDFLSRDDAAKYLRCSVRKIDRLKQSGRLSYSKCDGNTLFREEHLKALLSPPSLPPATQKSWTATRHDVSEDSRELPEQILRPIVRRAS